VLVADADATMVVVARFLALLDLFREETVAFDQATALGELTIRWTGTDSGDVTGWTSSTARQGYQLTGAGRRDHLSAADRPLSVSSPAPVVRTPGIARSTGSGTPCPPDATAGVRRAAKRPRCAREAGCRAGQRSG